jgi:uncharacterized membrane protein YbhN (UPF0104 family)
VFVEIMSSVPVGATVSVALLALVGSAVVEPLAAASRWAIAPAIAFAAAALLLVTVDRRRFPAFALKLLRLEGKGPLCPVVVPVVHAGYWALWASHGVLISHAVGADLSLSIASSGLYVMGPIVGFLAVAAPAGIGVREAVLSMGLASHLGPAPALAAAILSRAISLLADILAWALSRAILRSADR